MYSYLYFSSVYGKMYLIFKVLKKLFVIQNIQVLSVGNCLQVIFVFIYFFIVFINIHVLKIHTSVGRCVQQFLQSDLLIIVIF